MSWYEPKPHAIEAKKLGLFNTDEIEDFIGGDAGRCPNDHPSCLIFATKKGALHVRLGQYVVKHEDGFLETEDETLFNRKYGLIRKDPHGD